jgi:hypothetical protein
MGAMPGALNASGFRQSIKNHSLLYDDHITHTGIASGLRQSIKNYSLPYYDHITHTGIFN